MQRISKILRNGKEENLTEDHGYIKISGKMYKETFEISFDAEPVFVHANPQVRVDSAKSGSSKGTSGLLCGRSG